MRNFFDRFAYPDYAVGTIIGLCLIGLSFVLMPSGIHPLILFFMRFLGLLMAFFGTVWYAFNWFIDHGTKYIARR